MQEKWVDTLAQRGTLTAVTLEMAERGHSTAGLPRTASEEEVRKALNWNRAGSGWQWSATRRPSWPRCGPACP